MRISPLFLITTLSLSLAAQAARPENPAALMLQARALQRRSGGDDPEKAVALYRRAIALAPTSAEAHLRLSEALAECGDVSAALVPAAKATELAPKSAEAWAHLGILHYFLGRTDAAAWGRALGPLQRAAKLLPQDIDILMRLAEVAEAQKEDATAMDTWLRIGRLRPNAAIQGRPLESIAFERAALLASKIKHMEGRREALLALCRQTSPDRRHLALLEELARDQVQAGFLAHAEESFELLSRHAPEESAVFENMALIQLQTSRFEEALKSLDAAQRLRSTPGTLFHGALCLLNLGRFDEAETRLQSLLDLPEGSAADRKSLVPRAQQLKAVLLLLQHRPAETLAFLNRLPSQGPLLAMKAQALIQTEDWPAARNVLQEGIRKHKDLRIFQMASQLPAKVLTGRLLSGKASRQALIQLDREAMAGLYSEFRQWEKALEAVQQARAAAPLRDVELHLLQATVLENLGRQEEAYQVLREAQRLDPNHAMLQNNLGYTLLERGNHLEEAARLIESALKQDPQNGSTRDSWGWVLYKMGKLKEAETELKKAVTQSPYSPEILTHHGEVLLKLGRLEEALSQWERALAYVFPGRESLVKRASELRTTLAKQRSQATDTPDPEPDQEPDTEEEQVP